MNNFFDKKKLIKYFFFISFFFTGLSIVNDYGISYDEQEYRRQGFVVLNFIGEKIIPEKTQELKEKRGIEYPPINEFHKFGVNTFKIQHTLNALVEFLFFKNSQKKDIYLFRHYINFIFSFISFFLFYKILRLQFDWKYSLIGLSFFAVNPKMIPEFIYNPNDIWFMNFIIIFIFSSLKYFENNKIKYLLLIIFAIALAINVRFVGIYLYFIFIVLFFKNQNKFDIHAFKILTFSFILLIFILFLITPQFWYDPLGIFKTFYLSLGFKNFDPQILFMGNMINSSETPRYYLPLWMSISMPLMINLLFIIGFLMNFKILFHGFKNNKFSNSLLLFNLLFLIPLTFAIIFNTNLFNGWRHFYFLYPALIYFSLFGLYQIIIKYKFFYLKTIIYFFLTLNFFYLTIWSYNNHPYQNVFLNSLSKKYHYNFEGDYWGLANLRSLKKILNSDKKSLIKVSNVDDNRLYFSFNMLSDEEKKRIKYYSVDNKDIDYYISNLNTSKKEDYYLKNNFKIFEKITVNDYPINFILKKNNE